MVGGREALDTDEAYIVSISVTRRPDKTRYYEGDAFDPTGMVVTALYSDGRQETVADYRLAVRSSLTLSDDRVYVLYKALKASVEIEVREKMPWDGEGTEEEPYLIRTADDLVDLWKYVSEKKLDTAGLCFRMTQDINMKNISDWRGIADNVTAGFRGHFDGAGYAVWNLNGSTYNVCGLFGKLGDGAQADDGIYVLIKEVVDNSVDEFIMGAGRQIDISIADNVVSVRDYGRGIPLKSLAAAVEQMNTGGKYGGYAFKKTVGLNGVGVKAVNMLSEEFTARSVRDGEARTVTFAKGLEVSDRWESGVNEKNGTFISYRVDKEIFGEYAYNLEYVEQKIRNYSYLNLGLTLNFNGKSYVSKNGLLDLVNDNMTEDPLYPPIHLTGEDIEVVITHGTGYGESYFSFVNGQYTSQGGTCLLYTSPSPRD